MDEIELCGYHFKYVIVRKRIKNLYIRWHVDHFVVSAPFLCSKKSILLFFKAKEKTLYKMTQSVGTRQHLHLVDGEMIKIVGKEYKICFAETTSFTGNMLYLKSDNPLKAFLNVAKKELSVYIGPLFKKYFDLMYPNQKMPKVNYRVVKTYFGQYNRRSYLITFNVLLALVDPELIEYVVVHELAHIKYQNHQAEFKQMEEYYLPDYRQRQKRIKKESIML